VNSIVPKATRIEKDFHTRTPPKLLDVKLGQALLCDRRIPLRFKVGAFAVGYAGVAFLACVEFPFEEIIAVIPFIGILGDVALDGLEAIYVPFLMACLILPHLAPVSLVEQVRRERNPVVQSSEGPIIDV
jgi:hypothetical protein